MFYASQYDVYVKSQMHVRQLKIPERPSSANTNRERLLSCSVKIPSHGTINVVLLYKNGKKDAFVDAHVHVNTWKPLERYCLTAGGEGQRAFRSVRSDTLIGRLQALLCITSYTLNVKGKKGFQLSAHQ